MKKMKTALASSLTLLSLVVSLAPVSASSNNQRELEKEVAAGITGQERQIMIDVMKNLPKEERENVIYIDDNGQIHANKTELKNVFGKADVSEENTVAVSSNETFTLPKSTDSPALNKNASVTPMAGYACGEAGGPYRRVFSNPGFSWWSGNVYLPSSANNEVYVNNATSNDTPYIYTGGHASNGASEVDAGFQYSKTYNNWAHSIFTGGVYYHNTSFRFKAGQNLTFKFYVPADGQVALYAAGIRYDTNTADNYTVVTNASGWKKSGAGNEIKRITAIASNAPKPYSTGTYLKNVKWTNSMIGTSSTSNHQWLAADTGGYCTYPNSTQVSVNYVNAGEETVNISMN